MLRVESFTASTAEPRMVQLCGGGASTTTTWQTSSMVNNNRIQLGELLKIALGKQHKVKTQSETRVEMNVSLENSEISGAWLSIVAHVCNLSTLGGQGRRIA